MSSTDEDRPCTPSRHHYCGYGLVVVSELPLPELPAIDPAGRVPDITIRFGAVPELGPGDGPMGATRIGPFVWSMTGRFWLAIPGIVRIRITGGHEIVVEPHATGHVDDVLPFLLGTALGVLLMQRGHLVLHGNAIRVGEGCVVCVGPSGSGKSTVAAGFLRRGFALLSDDLVMVDDRGCVAPGVPRIKLWADTARAMTIDTGSLRRVRPNLEKFSYPARECFAQSALPVRAIYILAVTNTEAVRIDPVNGFAKIRAVLANTYRPQFVEALGLRERYLGLCARLATTASVARVVRPALGFTVDEIIDALLDDLRVPD